MNIRDFEAQWLTDDTRLWLRFSVAFDGQTEWGVYSEALAMDGVIKQDAFFAMLDDLKRRILEAEEEGK
jgi:hypothetical protein